MTSKIYSKYTFLFLCVAVLTACKSYYPIRENASLVKVGRSFSSDSSVIVFYKPYKDSLDKITKIPIVELTEDIFKKLPESTLGNLMADILKAKAEEYTKDKIDVAIVNYGGIRASSLTKGMLNIEDAYMLMPFDNYIVEQSLTGQQLIDFCDSIAVKKGWPVSGIAFGIKNGRAINILINDKPVNLSIIYKVALSDYLANGGDGMAFLKSIPQKQTGKLFRDGIIEYWKEVAKAGKKISAKLENRIIYAE